ncbi:histidine kinase [Actinoplanes sp. Pm04-4]|uniref:histidine kinase n=1 Tax=Paractinoplanes pyxinae TaxID=2997416 RepID=A0ABT4ASD5_9ACTN|nr:histidine kinase [Actinoplanes pyxinae]MCY1137072.1 histidine kinase [Actinoplanes pyxinae]
MVISPLVGLRTAVAGRDRGPVGHPLLSGVFVAAALGSALLVYVNTGGVELVVVQIALAAGVAVPIALLPHRPLIAWRLAMVATLLNLPREVAPDGLSWPWHPLQLVVLPALVLFIALVHRGATVIWVVLLTSATTMGHLEPSRALPVAASVVVLAVVGDQVRRRVEAQHSLVAERKLTAAEQERSAVLEERVRIAREMHDVVAHHMSMIAVRAETAPYRLSGEPETRDAEFVAIAGASRAALQDMRRLLGVLRSESADADATTPSPGLADLAAMVSAATASGLRVVLQAQPPVGRAAAAVPPLVGQAAYRIVQEGLSNATRHAPGSVVRVSVTADDAAVRVRVHNTAPAGPVSRSRGGGHGIRGMRERAGALGGTLSAGPADGGGYNVHAVLPLAAGEGRLRAPGSRSAVGAGA